MICVLRMSSILTARMSLKATASTSVPTRNVVWHAVWSTSTRISQSRKQRLSAKPSSPTSPRPSTSSPQRHLPHHPGRSSLHRRYLPFQWLGTSLCLSTVTMKSTTSKLVSLSFFSVKLLVSQCKTIGFKLRNRLPNITLT